MRKLILLIVILLGLLGILSFSQKRFPQIWNKNNATYLNQDTQKVKVVSEESVVIDVVDKVSNSVLTIAAITSPDTQAQTPSDLFPFFNLPPPEKISPIPDQPQNIGSGFVYSSDGIIVTNKHVVSDTTIKYVAITKDNKQYNVQKIYRDPLNDIAILKIDPAQNPGSSLNPVVLGDSTKLKVGQLAIAIGTPLGQFSNTVTTGVVSGLGRGITAGSVFEGFVEQLDNVIQTDAAINPGNSGGPLLNSAGQVIGVNTAVSQSGQNIGFALPINIVKESIKNFNTNGQFNRPYLGVSYRMLSKELAIRYDLAEGAYVQTVIPNSAADKAGIQKGDVITQFDGNKVEAAKGELAQFIAKKKVGDSITLTLFRKGKTLDIRATLEAAPQQ